MKINNILTDLNPKEIEFDKFNPRGESEDQIINDPDFHQLKKSISIHGIIIPIIVVKGKNSKGGYKLIDGERRLRASLDLNLDSVVVRIAESDIDGKILAYQIHQNRKSWNKPSEAKSIEEIIVSIKKKEPGISEADLKNKLIDITSHTTHSISAILDILKYDDETREKSAKGYLSHSYLVRIEGDFISPAKRVYPEILDIFTEAEIRKIMTNKAELKLLIGTRYMMSAAFKRIFKPHIYRNEIYMLLVDFLKSPEISASDLYNSFIDLGKSERDSEGEKTPPVPRKDPDGTSDQPLNPPDKRPTPDKVPFDIRKNKKTGFNAIKESLESIGTQFSVEELEYIKEAIVCLGSEKALRASMLMIWSASISRILKYIKNDIPKYNTISEMITQDPKSYFKNWVPTFQKEATKFDDIRERAKDMQLLCYLCHENIITKPQFKQLRGYHDIRNECAHPTSIELCTNEVLAAFENLYKFIFNNPHLK